MDLLKEFLALTAFGHVTSQMMIMVGVVIGLSISAVQKN